MFAFAVSLASIKDCLHSAVHLMKLHGTIHDWFGFAVMAVFAIILDRKILLSNHHLIQIHH